MKVIVFNPYMDTLGGGEKYTLAVCNFFLQKKYKVDMVFDKNIDISELKNRFQIPVEKINIIKIDINNLSFFEKFKLFRGYDYSFMVSDGSVPIPFSSKNFLHFQVPFNKLKPNFFEKLKLKLFDGIVVNSFFTKKVIDKTYSVNSQVLFPPVSIFRSSVKKNTILSIGRFDAKLNSKKQDILIEAFKIFSRTNKHYKLVLIGGMAKNDKTYLDSLRHQARGFRVEFFPNLNFLEMSKIISQAKIYWHATGFGSKKSDPEEFEHFGISILEAASAGAIPFVYNGGGPLDFIKHNFNGFIFSSIEELAEMTHKIIDDHRKYIKISSVSQKTARKFSTQNFYKNAEKIFG